MELSRNGMKQNAHIIWRKVRAKLHMKHVDKPNHSHGKQIQGKCGYIFFRDLT